MGWIYLPNCNNPMGTWIIIDQWISLFSHLDRAILFQQQGVSTHFRGDWVSSLADYWRHFQGMLLIFDTVLFDTIPARRLCWVRSFNSTQPDFIRFPHSAPLAPPRTWNGSGDRCGWWCSYPWFWSFAGRPARFAGAIGHPSISMVMKCYQCIPGIPVYQFY